VFYLTIPGATGGGLYWIMFVFAVLATVSTLRPAFVPAELPLAHRLSRFVFLDIREAAMTHRSSQP
jgi:hypothetical protein